MVVDDAVYVGRDAHVTLEASREMLQPGKQSEEQYRTTNLVGTSVTKICIVPTSAFNSYSRLSAGLDLAIDNYNSQGLRLTPRDWPHDRFPPLGLLQPEHQLRLWRQRG